MLLWLILFATFQISQEPESCDCHVIDVGEAGKTAVAKRCTRAHVRYAARVCTPSIAPRLAKPVRSKRSTNIAAHQEISRGNTCSMPGKHRTCNRIRTYCGALQLKTCNQRALMRIYQATAVSDVVQRRCIWKPLICSGSLSRLWGQTMGYPLTMGAGR